MKGLLGSVFLGICIIIAAGLLAGALTFPEAMSFIFEVMFWIIVVIVILVAAFFGIVIIALHHKNQNQKRNERHSQFVFCEFGTPQARRDITPRKSFPHDLPALFLPIGIFLRDFLKSLTNSVPKYWAISCGSRSGVSSE